MLGLKEIAQYSRAVSLWIRPHTLSLSAKEQSHALQHNLFKFGHFEFNYVKYTV